MQAFTYAPPSSKKLNILDLHRKINSKNMKKIECFDRVLELCHKRILTSSENKKTRVFYEVPDFMIGFPLYDINECIMHVFQSLKNNGFLAIYYFPKYMYISWDLDEIEKNKEEKQTFGNKDKLNQLDFKYKSSGKLTLDL